MRTSQPPVENPTVKIVGVGAAGCNMINHLICKGMKNIEAVAVDTDVQSLSRSLAQVAICIGDASTRSMGATGVPDIGRQAAEGSQRVLQVALEGSDLLFVVVGMGGGTGSGATPVIGRIARDLGAVTIGWITEPFVFEGNRRRRNASEAVASLRESLNGVFLISLDRLLDQADKKESLGALLVHVGDLLHTAVQGIIGAALPSSLVTHNIANIRRFLPPGGSLAVAVGRASGESRAIQATMQALGTPHLSASVQVALGILVTISGAACSHSEVEAVVTGLRKAIAPHTEIVIGAVVDEHLEDQIQVTLIVCSW